MAIQGLIGTDQFVHAGSLAAPLVPGDADYPHVVPGYERPTNWRQGILMRFPNGHAPLVALTSVMKKKVTDDPQYHWWERELANRRLVITPSIDGVVTTIPLVADPFGFGGGLNCKVGDVLRTEHENAGTYELMKVTGVASDTSITVDRGFAGTTALVVGATANKGLMIIGSVYAEGAETPESVRYRPVKEYNYTQIFRDSLKATRTAMHTRLRTVDEVRDAKQQALLYHSIGMEYGFIFGRRYEGLNGGQPERMTGGVVQFIEGVGNTTTWNATGTDNLAYLEDLLMEAFRFGSQEKVAFIGNRAMLNLQRVVRASSSLEITPTIKEYGMDVRRIFTPFGTLVCKTHPLFNQINTEHAGRGTVGVPTLALDTWMLILDMANLTYRPLRNSDTQYLPDRQGNGVDGITSEYLTEAGLEVDHARTHYLIKAFNAAANEDFSTPITTPSGG